jgi:pimeloyl-ACP methyl ester carboxylesterase
VLVHGAWVGEWCWAPVVELLEAAGRPVHAVTLTGHGERRPESGPHVTLDDHVEDLVEVFERHGLVAATLVGHSYGGRVITKAWPHLAARIQRMIFLDAHAPIGPEVEVAHRENGDGMIPFAGFGPGAGVFADDAEASNFYGRLAEQSARTLQTPFRVELPAELDKTYVHASAEASRQFKSYAEAARRDPAWHYIELPATHWLMYTHAAAVAAIIVGERAGDSNRRDERGRTVTAEDRIHGNASREPSDT